MTVDFSRELARFVVDTDSDDIPASGFETQKKSVLDAVAITLGAATLGDGCKEMVEVATENSYGAVGDAAVIGFGRKLPAPWAAFANASMAHSLDFGDTQMRAIVHSNASTFPAALAVAEKLGGVDGKTLLTALVIGSEVACRVSLGVEQDLERYGFYMPPIYTSFGATAAVCKLLKLTEEQVVDAFSFDLCQTTCSAELMNNRDTVVRSIREAFAAKNAVLSGLLAQKGLKGFAEPFEGKLGFYHAYARDETDLDRALEGLGSSFEAGTLYFKLWPSCAGTHPVIASVKKLVEEDHIAPQEIRRVHVVTSQRNRMLAEPEEIRKAPATSMIAKFSIPYTGAVAILRGDVTLDDFQPAALQDGAVKALAAKFTYEVNEAWGKAEGMNTDVTIFTDRGEHHHFYTEVGLPPRDATFEELTAKLRSCARHAVRPKSEEDLGRIADTIRHMESLEDIAQFTSLL